MRNLIMLWVTCAGAALAAGCATSYHPPAATSDYYVEEMALDRFRISYRGTGIRSDERVVDLALLRACHTAQERDFKYFAIVDQWLSSDEQTVYESDGSVAFLWQNSNLLIRCFASRPKDVFVFKAAALESIIRNRYRPGDKKART